MSTEKDAYASPVVLTITLASLASTTSGAGWQSTLIDNTSTGYDAGRIYYKIKLGTSPVAGNIYFFAIDNDVADSIVTDGGGSSNAAITLVNAPLVGTATTKPSPATGDVLEGSFPIFDLGPNFGIAVDQNTGVALDSTGSNHKMTFVGVNPTFS